MNEKKISVVILILLFVLVLLKGEFSSKKQEESEITETAVETEVEDSSEFTEGTIEQSGEELTDYRLEKFALAFDSEDLKKVFEDLGRGDYLTYSLYDYLYQDGVDVVDATILKDYQSYTDMVKFVVKMEEGEEVSYLNGTYQIGADTFEFEEVEATPGNSNSYIQED